ncbi:MAG: PEP-CTERM sorting domain-containing protein [Kiritimatiellales bacterium]|nr:PEP-CTERM sorting domain-containing protein [Kiritimatiellales bacterium]
MGKASLNYELVSARWVKSGGRKNGKTGAEKMSKVTKGLALVCFVLLGATQEGVAGNVVFTGLDANNNLFSTVGNWDTFPVQADSMSIHYQTGSSPGNPAQLDKAFSDNFTYFTTFNAVPSFTGTAYVEVLSGGVVDTINAFVGNSIQTARAGQLTLKTGSAFHAHTANNGFLTIGTGGAGHMIIENAAAVSFGNISLGANGIMTYEFGANSVSTFVSTKSNGAATMLLDGIIELDLSAGPAVGNYSLIDSSHVDTTMTGALATWLTGQGGSYTNTGSYAGANFKVLNGGTTEWVLSSANGGSTLNFTVIPEPATLGLFAVSIGMFMAIRKLHL